MESPPSDFLWGHPWTSPFHFYSCSLLPSPISVLSQPQSSPIGPYSSPSPPPSPGGTSRPLQYFPSYFPLVFLEGCCPSSSLAVTSLRLDPATWDSSAPSNRAASSSSTLSWSRWRYSIVLLFLSSSSVTLCLSASSLVLVSTSLLDF